MHDAVCVIIPVYNEARTIAGLVQKLCSRGLRVIVVDDGSTDGSGALAEGQGARVLRTMGRQGKGAALKIGFREALNNGCEGVLTMDGDGQHAVEDVGAFLRAANEREPCVITGNRMAHSQQMPWLRRLINRLMSAMISLAIRHWVPDTQCGFRYISREVLERIPFTTRSFEIETEVLMKAARRGYPLISIPVQCIYADEVSRICPTRDAIKFFQFYFQEIFRRH